MGMSTYVKGFRPPDEKFKQMKAVYDACVAAETRVPEEVQAFFEHEEPDESGIEVDLGDAVYDWDNGKSVWGKEIHLDELPKDVKYIRFCNSC